MRLTEFHELIDQQFGHAQGDALLREYVLLAVGGKTGYQAIEAGTDPRDVWRALCADFDVPKQMW